MLCLYWIDNNGDALSSDEMTRKKVYDSKSKFTKPPKMKGGGGGGGGDGKGTLRAIRGSSIK